MSEPPSLLPNPNEGLIPFSELQKSFHRNDVFSCNAQSQKFTSKEHFDAFSDELEDVMRKHGVFVLNASIFAEL